MKKVILLLCTALVCAAQTSFPVTQGKVYKLERIAEGVYYATGGTGSNNIVIVNDNDVVLVDTGTTPATARALLADIKLVTPKPVTTVVNTHFHYDHTNGNSIFGPEVEILAHDFVRKAITTFDVLNTEPMKTYKTVAMPQLIADLTKQAAAEQDPAKKKSLEDQLASAKLLPDQVAEVRPTPPTKTYSDQMILKRGNREIRLLHLGRAHTEGDTLIYLPQEKILCTGDLLQGRRLPYMGDGFFDEWVSGLEKIKGMDIAWILPGHGVPFSDKSLIGNLQAYLNDVTNKVDVFRRQEAPPETAAQKVDMTSHAKNFPQITGPGVEIRGVRRIYEWYAEREH